MSENSNPVREEVRSRYASVAVSVTNEGRRSLLTETPAGGCCEPAAIDESLVFGSALYDDASTADLPGAALLASLGCGNPTAVADLQAGETVLDLGSGGGIDVLLSARRVGPTGFAYGLDMTDEMLDLARHNAAAA